MANAKKCDRCGKLYEMYSGVPLIEGGNRYFALSLIDRNCDRRHFDICPECMTALISFINEPKKEES